MKKRIMILCIVVAAGVLMLTGCIPGDGAHTVDKPAGFFWGVWHGWLAPLSLIVGFFSRGIRLYETMNTGWWYDLGFYMAIISGFGGISLFRSKGSKK